MAIGRAAGPAPRAAKRSRSSRKEILEVIVVSSESAAVIAGADAQCAAFRAEFDDRTKPRPHRIGDSLAGQAVDDDLEHRGDLGRKSAVDRTFQGRAIEVVGRGARALIFRTNLRPRARYAAWKRRDDIRNLAHRFHRRLGRSEGLFPGLPHDNEIAAADSLLGEICGGLADKLSVHHRHPPVSPGAKQFGELPAGAEETNGVAELELVVA